MTNETYDGHKLGEIVVKDHGICKIVEVFDYGGYVSKTIIPKEIFVEAYRKYIIEGTEKENCSVSQE